MMKTKEEFLRDVSQQYRGLAHFNKDDELVVHGYPRTYIKPHSCDCNQDGCEGWQLVDESGCPYGLDLALGQIASYLSMPRFTVQVIKSGDLERIGSK